MKKLFIYALSAAIFSSCGLYRNTNVPRKSRRMASTEMPRTETTRE